MERTSALVPGLTDPEDMRITEKDNFGGGVGHRGRGCADHGRQRIRRTLADRDAEADRNIFIGVFGPGYRFEAGKYLSVIGGEGATAAGASVLIERTAQPATLAQRRKCPRILHIAAGLSGGGWEYKHSKYCHEQDQLSHKRTSWEIYL